MNRPASETSAAVVRLELTLSGEPKSLKDVRFSARYVASAETRIFHRLISGRYPDELRLIFKAADGRETIVDRIAMGLPVATRIVAGDFVTVSPSAPVTFEFPLWGEPALAPGQYAITAEHVGGVGTYTTDAGEQVDAGAYTGRIVSNPVQYRQN